MRNSYKPIKPMKEVPDQLRKLRRQFLRYQQAEIVYSLSHKKLFELASDAGAIYRFDSTVLINRDIFDAYLERFHEPATTHKTQPQSTSVAVFCVQLLTVAWSGYGETTYLPILHGLSYQTLHAYLQILSLHFYHFL